jgi:hypothetical protein
MAASFGTWRVILVMVMAAILSRGRDGVHKKAPQRPGTQKDLTSKSR